MKKIVAFLFFYTICNFSLSAQSKLSDVFFLDTIVPVVGISSDLLYQNKLKISIVDDDIFLSYQKDKSRLHLSLINKGKVKKQKVINIPRKYICKDAYTLICTTISKDYILFGYTDFFYIFKRKGHGIKFYAKIINNHAYDSYEIYGNQVFCCYSYNEAGGNKRVKISKFDIITKKIIKEVELEFKYMEYSHFTPRHWFAIGDEKLFLTNTAIYEFSVFDNNIDSVGNVKRKLDNWVEASDSVIKRIRDENYGARKTLNVLSKANNNEISRVEGIWCLNDSVILVRYFMKNISGEFKNRFFDIYKTKNDSIQLIYSSLSDVSFPLNMQEKVTKNNSQLWTWNFYNEIGSSKIVLVKPMAPIEYLGKTLLESKKDEEEFYKVHEPIVGIWVYKLKMGY